MAQQYIDTGSVPNSVGGESLRSAFDKVNDNFSELESATNPNIVYDIALSRLKRSSGTYDEWTDITFYQDEDPTNTSENWATSTKIDTYFRAPASGSIVETTFFKKRNNSNTFDSDGASYTLAIKINPPNFTNISGSGFDFEENFDFSLATSKSFSPNVDFLPGDYVGFALYKSAGTPFVSSFEYCIANVMKFILE